MCDADVQRVKGLAPVAFQDGPGRRKGAGGALAPQPGAGDLAACPNRREMPAGGDHAGAQTPNLRERCQRNKQRRGKQRGARVAQVDLARKLTEAIWHMLTTSQPFDPAAAEAPISV